jgi:hypothetical protein
MSRLDFADVAAAARGRWREILSGLGIADEHLRPQHGPCPGCGGTDRFRFDDKDGRGTFICSQGGGEPLAGDGWDLLKHIYGWDWKEAHERLDMPLEHVDRPVPPPRTQRTGQPWDGRLDALWGRCTPVAGTVGEAYLLARCCAIPPADGDLRFLPPWQDFPPALLARVTDAKTNEPLTLHRTPLLPDGSDCVRVDRKKAARLMKGYRAAGGVIRLWPDDSVTTGLGLAEGIETALSLAHAYQPVWATVNSGSLGAMPVLGGIESVLLAQDGDEAGVKACRSFAERWAEAGAEVSIVKSPLGEDLNDA